MVLTQLGALALYIGVVLLAGGAALVVHWRLSRRAAAALGTLQFELATAHHAQQQQVRLQQELLDRLDRVTASCERLEERLERLELRGGERSYGRAIALAQRGGETEDLIRDFGLSKAEAELVSVVHARRVAN